MRLALVLAVLWACSFAPGQRVDGDGNPIPDDAKVEGDGTIPGKFSKRKPITIGRSRVGKAGAPLTLASYPLLYSVTDPDLRLAPIGSVTDAQGDDIVFKDAAGTQLAHEIEAYDAATGRLVAWVNVPTLNTITATTDTTIYIYYGDDELTTSTQQPTAVWDSAFEGVWHLDEDPTAPAPQMNDHTLHARNGTAQGGAIGVDGIVAGGVGFDGMNDSVRIGEWTLFTNKTFTLEVWMRPETTTLGQEVALSFHNANSNQQSLHMRIYNDGGLRFSYFGQDLSLPANTIPMAQWHHFVATYNATNDMSRIYLGGFQVANGNQGPFTAVTASGAIGAWDGCSPCDQFFKGRIDEVRVSSVERSVHWLSTEYANIHDPLTFTNTGLAEDVP